MSALTLAAKLASNPSCPLGDRPLGDRPLGSSSVAWESGSPSSSSRPAASARHPQQRASNGNAGMPLLHPGLSSLLCCFTFLSRSWTGTDSA